MNFVYKAAGSPTPSIASFFGQTSDTEATGDALAGSGYLRITGLPANPAGTLAIYLKVNSALQMMFVFKTMILHSHFKNKMMDCEGYARPDSHPGADSAGRGAKNDESCLENDEFCIENDEFCINNDEFCIQMMEVAVLRPRALADSELCRSAPATVQLASETLGLEFGSEVSLEWVEQQPRL